MNEALMNETKPLEITLVRHAESRANVAQALADDGEPLGEYADVHDFHDSEAVLSHEGRRQVERANLVLEDLGILPSSFDVRLCSTLIRTIQTAAGLEDDPYLTWKLDGKLVERDWGHYGALSVEDREKEYPFFDKLWKKSKFFARQPNGQSISDVTFQFRAFLNRLNDKYPGKRVMAVTHGETMQAARAVLEGLSPHEWNDMKEAGELSVKNLQMIQWSRLDPHYYYGFDGGDIQDSIAPSFSTGWRRIINLADPAIRVNGFAIDSPWVKLDRPSTISVTEMHDLVERFEPHNRRTIKGNEL